MDLKIGKESVINGIERCTIGGNKAPELDCHYLWLKYCNNIFIDAVKCGVLWIYDCDSVCVTGSVFDEVRIQNSKKVEFIGCTIRKILEADDKSEYGTSMCIIGVYKDG